jgi:hypothetical protein
MIEMTDLTTATEIRHAAVEIDGGTKRGVNSFEPQRLGVVRDGAATGAYPSMQLGLLLGPSGVAV